ncbi:hypothetical protein AVEN_36699-1 [Araneus ventricosus]|uniref:Uncharacterized protein n=1 Tax=Araneus ventricosus TaxID=182803 RepID=A0A4Y2P7E0_ARAVE|nr:hypothetical protein AVEN_36699-1 [Araneus ventricosus]
MTRAPLTLTAPLIFTRLSLGDSRTREYFEVRDHRFGRRSPEPPRSVRRSGPQSEGRQGGLQGDRVLPQGHLQTGKDRRNPHQIQVQNGKKSRHTCFPII